MMDMIHIQRIESDIEMMTDRDVGRMRDADLAKPGTTTATWANALPIHVDDVIHDMVARMREMEAFYAERLSDARTNAREFAIVHPIRAWLANRGLFYRDVHSEKVAIANDELQRIRSRIDEITSDPGVRQSVMGFVTAHNTAARTGREVMRAIDNEPCRRQRISVYDDVVHRFGAAVYSDVKDVQIVRTSDIVALSALHGRGGTGHGAWHELIGYSPTESIDHLACMFRSESDAGLLRSGVLHGMVDAKKTYVCVDMEISPETCTPMEAQRTNALLRRIVAEEPMWNSLCDEFGDWLRTDLRGLAVAKTSETVGLAASQRQGGPVWIDLSYIRGFDAHRSIDELAADFKEMIGNRESVWQCGLGDSLWSRAGRSQADNLFISREHDRYP